MKGEMETTKKKLEEYQDPEGQIQKRVELTTNQITDWTITHGIVQDLKTNRKWMKATPNTNPDTTQETNQETNLITDQDIAQDMSPLTDQE